MAASAACQHGVTTAQLAPAGMDSAAITRANDAGRHASGAAAQAQTPADPPLTRISPRCYSPPTRMAHRLDSLALLLLLPLRGE